MSCENLHFWICKIFLYFASVLWSYVGVSESYLFIICLPAKCWHTIDPFKKHQHAKEYRKCACIYDKNCVSVCESTSVEKVGDCVPPDPPCPAGILDQSAVWVDELNYYDMRTDRNKGISPLSLRPSNPLGIDIDKYGAENMWTHTKKNRSAQSHCHKHKCSSHWVMVYIPKQKQTLPICWRLKYYANTAMAEQPLTAPHREWKQNNCV